jgi:hypothetical protein
MNAVAPRKPRALSQFEGMVLSAVFQAFPTFTAAALLVKLSGASSMTSHAESVLTFIILAVLFQSIAVTCLGARFPRFFKQAYEPLFYDATLSLGEKLARWRVQPMASRQLLTTMMMLSVLGAAVMMLE